MDSNKIFDERVKINEDWEEIRGAEFATFKDGYMRITITENCNNHSKYFKKK